MQGIHKTSAYQILSFGILVGGSLREGELLDCEQVERRETTFEVVVFDVHLQFGVE